MVRLTLAPELPAGDAGDPGLFAPDSMTWVVARERALLLGGPAAVLLQLAHPLVAAGVAQYSDFGADPTRRLVATMNVSLAVMFGDRRQAAQAAARVRRRHERVTGVLPAAHGRWPAGTPFRAADPALAMWVFSTLVTVGLDSYELFVGPLTRADRCRYYDESAPFAAAFGVVPPVLPAGYAEFEDYYRSTLHDQVAIGAAARDVVRGLFTRWLGVLPVSPAAPVLAALLLPDHVRRGYRLPPVPRAVAWPVRQAVRRLPRAVRYWPHYFVACRRVGRGPC